MDTPKLVLDALDDLTSSRSSLSRRSRALNSLERFLAEICGAGSQRKLEEFLALQNGFEGNVASRIMASLSMYLPALQQVLSSTSNEDPKAIAEMNSLIQHTQQSFCVLQGVALLHSPSKAFLGRKSSIHLLLDILSISRNAPSPSNLASSTASANTSFKTTSTTSTSPVPPSLASALLDTLLCVLVDSPNALRTFEEANGVETVVKTLKRAGVARDVRMKCLEFLYFYLLPEDGSPPAMSRCTSTPSGGPCNSASAPASAPSKSVPGSPIHTEFAKLKPAFVSKGSIVTDQSSATTSGDSRPPSPTKRTTSKPNPQGKASGSKLKTSLSSSTSSDASSSGPATPTEEDQRARPASPQKKTLALQILQRDVDFTPMSPKKAQVSKLGVGTPGRPRISPLGPSGGSASSDISEKEGGPKMLFPSMVPSTPARKRFSHKDDQGAGKSNMSALEERTNRPRVRVASPNENEDAPSVIKSRPMGRIRSTEEKKELLGAWLGNVDALVEGVQKAGVFGLA